MVTQTKQETLTLGEVTDRFLNRYGLSPRTRDYYHNILANLNWYARQNGWPEHIKEITRDHVRDFVSYVAREKHRWPQGQRPSYQRQAAPATVYHYAKVVKTLFNWAEDEEYLEASPVARLKIQSPHYRSVEPYTDQEVLAFLAVCDGDISNACRYLGIRNKAIISLFVATGLRLGELSSIKLSDFDPRLQQVRVMGKGAKERVVPLNGEARKAVKRYLGVRPNGYEELWQTDDGQPMSPYSVKIMVRRLKGRAGVNGGGGAHRFRHYFATHFLEAGGDINSLRLLLGHATLSMVLRYSRYVDVQRALTEHHLFNPLDRLMRQSSVKRGWHY
ncbi:Tyrosine recombinase XerC [subsurface metagenome]